MNSNIRYWILIPSILVVLVSFFPIDDGNDAWWHLKAGKLFWEGEIGWYSNDPFTLTASQTQWRNHEWLGQILFHLGFLAGGFKGAIIFKTLVVLVTFLLVFTTSLHCLRHSSAEGNPFPVVLATCLAIATSQFTLYLRPPVYTFLFLALYHHFYLRIKSSDSLLNSILLFALSMVLWANLHGGAILGCVIMGLLAVGETIDWILSKWKNHPTIQFPKKIWVICFCTFFASLINPYGIHLHSMTLEVMAQTWVLSRISEMQPPLIHLIWTLPFLLIPSGVHVLRKRPWGEKLVFLFLLWQGLSHVRHLPLQAIWCTPYAAVQFNGWEIKIKAKQLIPSVIIIFVSVFLYDYLRPSFLEFLTTTTSLSLLLLALCAVPIGVHFFFSGFEKSVFVIITITAIAFVVIIPGQRLTRFYQAIIGPGWDSQTVPDRLCEMVLETPLPGELLLSRETYGGYLIWKLSPERLRLFTCSRYELQGGIPIKELETMLWLHPKSWVDPDSGKTIQDWRTLWNQNRFPLVLIPKYSDAVPPERFPLWDYLSNPASGYVLLQTEAWPGTPYPTQEFGLFIDKSLINHELLKKMNHSKKME